MTGVSQRPFEADDPWFLRPVGQGDLDAVLTLAHLPLVYRYLFDGAAPDRAEVAELIAASMADPIESAAGMWLLQGGRPGCSGMVQLRPDFAGRSAELIYLLHPAVWGQGLAARMAWSAICRGFGAGRFDRIIAVADSPNAASIAVMRRLDMRFQRPLEFPLGAGVEYALDRYDPGPASPPILLPFRCLAPQPLGK